MIHAGRFDKQLEQPMTCIFQEKMLRYKGISKLLVHVSGIKKAEKELFFTFLTLDITLHV